MSVVKHSRKRAPRSRMKDKDAALDVRVRSRKARIHRAHTEALVVMMRIHLNGDRTLPPAMPD